MAVPSIDITWSAVDEVFLTDIKDIKEAFENKVGTITIENQDSRRNLKFQVVKAEISKSLQIRVFHVDATQLSEQETQLSERETQITEQEQLQNYIIEKQLQARLDDSLLFKRNEVENTENTENTESTEHTEHTEHTENTKDSLKMVFDHFGMGSSVGELEQRSFTSVRELDKYIANSTLELKKLEDEMLIKPYLDIDDEQKSKADDLIYCQELAISFKSPLATADTKSDNPSSARSSVTIVNEPDESVSDDDVSVNLSRQDHASLTSSISSTSFEELTVDEADELECHSSHDTDDAKGMEHAYDSELDEYEEVQITKDIVEGAAKVQAVRAKNRLGKSSVELYIRAHVTEPELLRYCTLCKNEEIKKKGLARWLELVRTIDFPKQQNKIMVIPVSLSKPRGFRFGHQIIAIVTAQQLIIIESKKKSYDEPLVVINTGIQSKWNRTDCARYSSYILVELLKIISQQDAQSPLFRKVEDEDRKEAILEAQLEELKRLVATIDKPNLEELKEEFKNYTG
ncbi:MAG: hypothetical protein ACPGUD_00225 [Parashewanella sp.]